MTELRWKQRFQNFEKAFLLLREALENQENLSPLEMEGVVQRFEFTFELAWKTLKDYLEYNGIVLTQITPRSVIKAAFAAKVIKDGQLWVEMLEQRNLMSHVYDQKALDKIIADLSKDYLGAIDELVVFLKEKSLNQ